LDTNIVREFFEDSKLSFVDSELMQWLIWVKPWSVSPYALINNQEKNISVIFDSSLIWKDIWLHPLQNDNTIVSNFENIKKYLIHLWFDIHVLEL
jgi:Ala-tRNA(Pro) deacylase